MLVPSHMFLNGSFKLLFSNMNKLYNKFTKQRCVLSFATSQLCWCSHSVLMWRRQHFMPEVWYYTWTTFRYTNNDSNNRGYYNNMFLNLCYVPSPLLSFRSQYTLCGLIIFFSNIWSFLRRYFRDDNWVLMSLKAHILV